MLYGTDYSNSYPHFQTVFDCECHIKHERAKGAVGLGQREHGVDQGNFKTANTKVKQGRSENYISITLHMVRTEKVLAAN